MHGLMSPPDSINALSSVDYGNMPLLSAPIGRVPSYSNQWNPTPIHSSPNDSLLPNSTSATWNDDTSFFNSDLLPPQNSTGFHSSYGSYQTVSLPYSRFLTPSPEPDLLAMLLGLEQGLPVITEEELASIGTLNRENEVNNIEDDKLISSSNDGRIGGGGEGEGMWRAFGEEDGSSEGSRERGDKQPLGDPFDIVSNQNRNQRRRQSAPDVNYGYNATSAVTTMPMDLGSDNGGGRGDDNDYVNVGFNRRSTIDVPHHNQHQLTTPDDVLRRSTSRDMSFEEQQIQLRAAASLDGFMSANASRSNSNQIPMPTVPAITSEPYNHINLDSYQFNTSTYHEHRQSQLLHQSNQPQQQQQQQQYQQQQQQQYQPRQDPLPHQSQTPYDRQLQSTYFAELHQVPKPYFDTPTPQLLSGPAQPAYHHTNSTPSSHELANLVILPSPAQQSSNFSFNRDQEMNAGKDQQYFAANSRPSTAYSQRSIQHDSPPSPLPLLPIDLINSMTIDVKPAVANKGKRSRRAGKSTRSIHDNNTPPNAVASSSSSIDRTSNDLATSNTVSVTRAVANGSTSAATTNRKNRNPHATQLPCNGTRKGIKAEATEDHAGPICSHCDAITTPLWRRGKEDELLCNACGLYEKLHGKPRPTTYAKQSVGLRGKTASGAASLAAASLVPPSCSNCGATSTPMWRKDAEKKLCCNACSLYYKLHGKLRPSSLSSRQPERNRRATASAVTAAPASSSSSPTSSVSTPILNSPLGAPQIVLAKSRSTSTSPSSVESLSPHARGSQAPASPLLAVVASLLPSSSSSPSSSSGILPPPPHPPTKTRATSLSLSVNLSLTSLPTPSSALASHHQSMSPKSSSSLLLSPALFNSRASASSNLAWRNSLTPEIRSTSPMYAASERGGSSSRNPIHGNDRTTMGDVDLERSKRRRGGETQPQIELEEGGGIKRPRRMDSWERVGGAGALLHLMPSTGPTVADRVLSSSNYGNGNIAIKREV